MQSTSTAQLVPGSRSGDSRPRVNVRGGRAAALLVRAGRSLAGSLDLDTVAGELARLAVPSLADWCVVDLLGEDGRARHAASSAVDAARGDALRELVSRHPHAAGPFSDAVAEVLATGRARLLERPSDPAGAVGDEGQRALLGALGHCSALVVPLAADGAPVGALVLGRAGVRGPGPTDVAAAEELGALAGLAVRNATLYARAQRATSTRDEVLGVVAHDLRNPLMAVSMYAHVLLDAGLPPEQEEWVSVVLRNAERMNALIQDLLDISALEAGRLRVRPAPCTVGPLLGEALQLVERQANAAGVRLSAEPGAELPPVLADRDRVLQVLSNLLGNAVKFTSRDGAVEVAAERRGAEVVIRVRDEGQGIAVDDLPRVFDRFWQGAAARKGGAGLGLAIARGIVESHGGRIWAESVPGQGSTFLFALPVSDLAPAAPRAELDAGAPAEAETAADRATVLLVDDHSFIRRGLRELIGHAPGLVVAGEAESADEAVRRAAELRPHVVLMELNLPGGGLEATRRIVAGTPSTRVLILTAEPDDACVREALKAGASGYLRKSAEPGALLAGLRAVRRGERVLDAGLHGWASEQAGGDAALSEDAVPVLTLYACGYAAAEIAARLGMRVRAANQLRARSMRALGLSTRAELVRYALRQGWLGPGGCPPGTLEPAAARVSGATARCGAPPPAPAAGRTSGRTG